MFTCLMSCPCTFLERIDPARTAAAFRGNTSWLCARSASSARNRRTLSRRTDSSASALRSRSSVDLREQPQLTRLLSG